MPLVPWVVALFCRSMLKMELVVVVVMVVDDDDNDDDDMSVGLGAT